MDFFFKYITCETWNSDVPGKITCYPFLWSFHLYDCPNLRLWVGGHSVGSDIADIHDPPTWICGQTAPHTWEAFPLSRPYYNTWKAEWTLEATERFSIKLNILTLHIYWKIHVLKCGGKSNGNTATSPTKKSLDSIYQKEITQNTLFGPFSEHFYTTWILTTVAIAYHILDYFDRNSRMLLDKIFDKLQPFVHFLCVAENLPRRKRLRFNGSWGAQSGAPESDYSSVIFRIKCNASGWIRLEDSPFTHKVYVFTLKTHIINGIFKYSKFRAHLHFPFLTFILLTPKSQTDYLNYVSTSFY